VFVPAEVLAQGLGLVAAMPMVYDLQTTARFSSALYSPQMIGPSGSIFSKVTVGSDANRASGANLSFGMPGYKGKPEMYHEGCEECGSTVAAPLHCRKADQEVSH
jgi:hypothetical protein